MNLPAEGGCHCRAIRYRVTAEPLFAVHCHCRDCQYASGGAGATAALVRRDAVDVQGTARTYTVTADSGQKVTRHFCGTCGSPLFSTPDAAPELFVVKAASFDDPNAIEPAGHIWTRSAPRWVSLDDGLPCWATNFGETRP